MSFFRFIDDDFKNTVDDERFINCLKVLFNSFWGTSEQFFRGEGDIIKKLEESGSKVNSFGIITGNYEILKQYSMPYISHCEDPLYYEKKYGKDHEMTNDIKRDFETRNCLLHKITNKYNIHWWSLIHDCDYVAMFILYPICKILWPDQKFYLYDGLMHKVILNKPLKEYKIYHKKKFIRDINQACVFDIIGQSIDADLDFVFYGEDAFSELRCIDEINILKWYETLYGHKDDNFDGIKQIYDVLQKNKD